MRLASFVLRIIVLLFLFPARSHGSSAEYLIIFTGEDNGRLEPCGCATAQLGGLPRRHSFLEHVAAAYPGRTLLISNGDLSAGVSRQGELKFQTAVAAMNLMNYRLMNLGEGDLAFGADFLRSMKTLATFEFISSNLVLSGGEVFFERLVAVEFGSGFSKFSIHATGFVSNEFQDRMPPGLEILDPRTVLAGMLQANRGNRGYWLVLYHGDIEEAIENTREHAFSGVIIAGHARTEPPEDVVRIGEKVYVYAPVDGKYTGILKLRVDPDGRVEYEAMEQAALDGAQGQSASVDVLLKDYQEHLRNERLYAGFEDRIVLPGRSFTGSDACAACHESAHQAWAQSRHSQGYASLVHVERSYDPDCLKCHTTGFEYTGGFSGSVETPHMAAVGCESCHGPGSLHAEAPAENKMERAGPFTCERCHDPENSPQFDFEKYWKKIKHGF